MNGSLPADERILNEGLRTGSSRNRQAPPIRRKRRRGATQMNKHQEKVLVATLCGLVIAAAGAFAVQPAMAAGYQVDVLAKVSNVADWDVLNVRKWPASYSQQVGAIE